MAGERGHTATAGRDCAHCVDRAECLQQIACLAETECRRRSKPRQRLGFTSTPGGDGEQHLRQVRFQYLRPAVFLHPGFSSGTPQAVASAWGYAAGTAGALPGHVPADAHGLQPAQAALRVEDKLAAQSRVYDYAYILYGE